MDPVMQAAPSVFLWDLLSVWYQGRYLFSTQSLVRVRSPQRHHQQVMCKHRAEGGNKGKMRRMAEQKGKTRGGWGGWLRSKRKEEESTEQNVKGQGRVGRNTIEPRGDLRASKLVNALGTVWSHPASFLKRATPWNFQTESWILFLGHYIRFWCYKMSTEKWTDKMELFQSADLVSVQLTFPHIVENINLATCLWSQHSKRSTED